MSNLPATIDQNARILDLTPWEAKANLLVPVRTIEQLSPLHLVRVHSVQLNPDPTKGDVYKDGKQLRPAKVGLLKLATAAGIVWHFDQSRIVHMDANSVVYQAVGAMPSPDGSWLVGKGTKEINLEVLEEEIHEQQTKKADQEWDEGQNKYVQRRWAKPEARQEFIETNVRKELLQKRKNRLALAETGAFLRCIRALLSLKANYTQEELQKPFVVVRVYLDPSADLNLARARALQGPMWGVQPQQIEAPVFSGATPPTIMPEAPDEDEEQEEAEPDPTGEVTEGEAETGLVIPEPHLSRLLAVKASFFGGAEVSWQDDQKRRAKPLDASNGQLKLHDYTDAQRLALYTLLHWVGTGERIDPATAEETCDARSFVAIQALGTPVLKELREAAAWFLASRNG